MAKNMLKMMKDATGMQRQLKKVQKDLARKTVDFENAGITVRARGDMQIVSVDIDPDKLSETPVPKLGKQVVTAVNGALSAAKRQAGAEMSKLTGGMEGLSGMMGG